MMTLDRAAKALNFVLAIFSVFAAPHTGDAADTKTSASVIAGENELREILSMMASMQRANREAIKTWVGVYAFEDCFKFPGVAPTVLGGEDLGESEASRLSVELGRGWPTREEFSGLRTEPGETAFWEISRGEMNFSIDVAKDKCIVAYYNTKPVVYRSVGSGTIYQWPLTKSEQRWVLTPEEFLSVDVGHNSGQEASFPTVDWLPPSGGKIAYRRAARDASSITRVVSPLGFLTGGAYDYAEFCRRTLQFMENSQTEGRTQSSVSRTRVNGGEVISVSLVLGARKITAVFDSRVGYCVSELIAERNGSVMERRRIQYVAKSGAFIPAVYRVEQHPGGAASPAIVRTFSLKSCELNQSLGDKVFSMEALGLNYGDRMADYVAGNLMVVGDNGQLVPVSDFTPDWARMPAAYQPYMEIESRGIGRGVWVGLNLSVIVLILSAIVIQRKRGGGGGH